MQKIRFFFAESRTSIKDKTETNPYNFKKMIKTKRIYEAAANDDGYRVLVDRLWPRGISKESAKIDEWLKEIAPSSELRKWFDHQDELYDEFNQRYKIELENQTENLQRLKDIAQKQALTLLYGAKNEQHNQAVVLLEVLKSMGA